MILFSCFHGENQQGKSIFPVRACAVRVWLTRACVFATKTMAVRIFRRGKIANFRGFFPQLCTYFSWRAMDSGKVSFYLLINVKIM